MELEKKIYGRKKMFSIFLLSALSAAIGALVVLAVLWNLRMELVQFFSEERLLKFNEDNFAPSLITQENFIINAVEKSNPAVVSILITKEVPRYEIYFERRQSPFGNFFPYFNFTVPKYRELGKEEKEVGSGSGFFVSSDGLIITNKHVVDDPEAAYTVFTNDGERHQAKVVTLDSVLDIALIKIEGVNFPALPLGDSDVLKIGQSVIAIGNALGEFRNTVSVGVISGLARSITASSGRTTETLDQVIQTDAAINPGNSGGPLLDLTGKAIGVNVAVVQGSQSIGFALPINAVKKALNIPFTDR